MVLSVDQIMNDVLNARLAALEQYLQADVLCYYGPIPEGVEQIFLHIIEQLANDEKKSKTLYILLTTTGGSAFAVERLVNIVRRHYDEVNFIVPNYAYSAGTIFCMSGDNIFMDYYSVLGPIDPQVLSKEGRMVPALGYLDKINELIDKGRKNELSQAEFIILKEFDLAELRNYEQAIELTIELLKKWLVQYKFKNWEKDGTEVTLAEKEKRAKEIADELSNSNRWKSHGRPINMATLENDLKLKIEDFGKDKKLSELIRAYDYPMVDYNNKRGLSQFFHTRRLI